MSKVFLILALITPFASLVLAKRATDVMPSQIEVRGHLLRSANRGNRITGCRSGNWFGWTARRMGRRAIGSRPIHARIRLRPNRR